ncbi:protein APCDD1-like [Homalodisca vitripennis]|uniref:protein APCDD1-like n=1 Tax=Homalodisca vitripennis TaxID=197043 RepID=UPI001EEC97EF|nr:protein APCDD1-like [Homalodisca vitripennis]
MLYKRANSVTMCKFATLLLSVLVSCSQSREEPVASDSCGVLEREVSLADLNTEILHPPPLTGKWVSQRCEVRPGPEFLLRSHTFLPNGTFHLIEFHYGDESCSQPLYSLSGYGQFWPRGRSWLAPGGTDVDYALARVTVTAHNTEMAENLASRINATCPGQVRRRWRPYREHVILTQPEHWGPDNLSPLVAFNSFRKRNPLAINSLGKHKANLIPPEIMQCLSALHATFYEVQLVRVQRRPHGPPDPRPLSRRPWLELLLGDVQSSSGQSSNYRPTSFQTPLLRTDQIGGCDVCHAVSKGWERAPPQLLSQPRLPPLLAGEWTSARCESRPLGIFLSRRLLVIGHQWSATYRFFSDPKCTQATLTASVRGHFSQTPGPSRVHGAADFDFHVEGASVILLDQGLRDSLQRSGGCGTEEEWKVGVPRDVTPWHGCSPLGLLVPSVQYELARVEISPRGTPLLFLGQSDASSAPWGPRERPTAFQPPLVQCSGELPLFSHFLGSSAISGQTSCHQKSFASLILTVLIGTMVSR